MRVAIEDVYKRQMYVPAGQHTIEMRFDPTSLHVTEGIAYGALALLVIGIIAVSYTHLIAGITILCLADMWGVNKRYLNDAQFVPH